MIDIKSIIEQTIETGLALHRNLHLNELERQRGRGTPAYESPSGIWAANELSDLVGTSTKLFENSVGFGSVLRENEDANVFCPALSLQRLYEMRKHFATLSINVLHSALRQWRATIEAIAKSVPAIEKYMNKNGERITVLDSALRLIADDSEV